MTDNNFAIKCGAAEMRNSEGIVFEADDSALGAASYYITSARKWAVSNVGSFSDRSGASYIDINTNPIFDTKSPELFQNSRISPGSLRYYGLNLENGNYTVTLEFAETVFRDRSSKTWLSLARRVFNIYIQVTIAKAKNLNILIWTSKGIFPCMNFSIYDPI